MELNTITTEYNNELQNDYSGYTQDGYIKTKSLSPFDDIKMRISEIIESIINNDDTTIQDKLTDKFLDLDFGSEFDIDASKIGISDAVFFLNLLKENNVIEYNINDEKLVLNVNNKKISATPSLLNMLKTSLDTKKPIRLDFDKDVTVILKLDKDGKILTHFIPGTQEAENYLKNNISCLKQRFDDENINYSYLGYSKSKQENNNSKRQKRSNQ